MTQGLRFDCVPCGTPLTAPGAIRIRSDDIKEHICVNCWDELDETELCDGSTWISPPDATGRVDVRTPPRRGAVNERITVIGPDRTEYAAYISGLDEPVGVFCALVNGPRGVVRFYKDLGITWRYGWPTT